MNTSFISALVLASALAAPAFAFAQSDSGVTPTRAEVKAELVQLEKAGYNPASDRVHYPDALLAAEARVDALQGVATSAYGSSMSGTRPPPACLHGCQHRVPDVRFIRGIERSRGKALRAKKAPCRMSTAIRYFNSYTQDARPGSPIR